MSSSSSPSDSSRAVSANSDSSASTVSSSLLLDPRNDYVFKRIFAQRVDLLSDLVNVIRGDAAPLTLTEVLNPTILPEEITGKGIVLDVKALDTQGKTIDVEVQVSSQRDYPARSLYYIARAFVEQLSSGEQYGQLRTVIGVNILNFALFRAQEEEERAQWRFGMVTYHQPQRALDVQLELNFLELPKLKRLGLEKTNKPLYDWSVFFSDVNNGEAMEQITHPDVKEAFEILKSVSATAQERLEAERRITYVRELNAIAGYQWDEGMAQGIAIGEARGEAKGRSEGKAEGKAEAARALVARQLERKFGPLGPEQWALLESATMEQLEHYSDTLLTASSLDEVFVE
jgi:predicted transposase/invertase (TIGR01784 family)